MARFDKRDGLRLPPDFAHTLEQFGRHEFWPVRSTAKVSPTIEYDLWQLAQPDPDAFMHAVVDVATATGGWALYGGVRAVHHAVGSDVEDPGYTRMLDAAIEHVLAQGYTLEDLPPIVAARSQRTR